MSLTKKIFVLIIIFVVGGIILEYHSWHPKEASIFRAFRIFQNEKISISAGVVPHHLAAKDIIEDFFGYLLSKGKPETIILLSPDHFRAGSILGNTFITLKPGTQNFYGIKIDNSLLQKLSLNIDFAFSNSSIALDQGITNLLPFIKKYFPQSKIIPFIIPFGLSQGKLDKFVDSLNSLSPKNAIVVASVDFSHYLSPSAAQFHNLKSIRTLINFAKEDFKNLEVDSWQALYIARAFARLRNKEFPKFIAFGNSTDFFENKISDKTTSYFSVVFEKGNKKKKAGKLEAKTILFVGDMMLDRGVEYLMEKNSVFYPFEKINQFLKGTDIVVGNLEGPIVKNPPYFGANSLRFAFSPKVIEGLSFANFNLLSLANNHTFNMGERGFEQSQEFLSKRNINFVGHPINCDKDFLFEEDNIIFMAFNKTFPFNCSNEKMVKIVKKIRISNPGKFLIVIFHWGQEYHQESSTLQQKLAHQVIDAGADLIIGSHPHVVQEIEEYHKKFIFYSLGNFIFDQYFSKEVQQGLGVGLEIYKEKLVYRLFPIKSHLSQPFLMEQEEAKEFLERLAQRSDKDLTGQIKKGVIEISTKHFQAKKQNNKQRIGQSKADKEEILKNISPQLSGVDLGPFPKPKGQLVEHLFNINYMPSPKAVVFSPDGKEIWVSFLLNKKRGVSVFDSERGKKIADINLNNGGGVEMAFSKDGSKVYVSQMETAKIFEIDANTKRISRVFNAESTWTKVLELSSKKKLLYASNWSGDNVSEIDLQTGKVLRKISVVDTPRGLYLTSNDEFLYVAGFGRGEIEKINLKTGRGKVIFKSGGAMRHIVGDEEKGVIYVSDMAKNTIWKVDLKTDKVEKFVETDNNPNTIALSPDKKILFVSCRGKNFSPENYYVPGPEWGSVLLFDTETGEMLDAIVGGNQPTGLAVSPDGELLVFSDFLDNRLEVFKVPSYQKLKQGKGGRSKIYKQELKK